MADIPTLSRPYWANQPHMYRALLHQTSITYWEMRPYPVQMDPPQADPTQLINPKHTEPSYTKPVEPIEKWGGPPPIIDPKCSESYYTKSVEPIEKCAHTQCRWIPPQAQVYRALLHHRGPPLLIEPKCTGTYYTKAVQPIENWGGPPLIFQP